MYCDIVWYGDWHMLTTCDCILTAFRTRRFGQALALARQSWGPCEFSENVHATCLALSALSLVWGWHRHDDSHNSKLWYIIIIVIYIYICVCVWIDMTIPPSRHILGEGVSKNYSALIQTCKRPGWSVREYDVNFIFWKHVSCKLGAAGIGWGCNEACSGV